MPRKACTVLSTLSLFTVLALTPASAAAQESEEMDGHGGPYAGGECTFCAPYVWLQGAALFRPEGPDSDYDTDFMLRGVIDIGTPSPHIGLFTHVQIVPSDDPLPSLRAGLQVWVLPRFSNFNVTGGLGFIHDPDVVRGWGHVGLELQTRIHDIALYAQAGTRFAGDDPEEFQIGVRHPLAPWKFHGIP